MLFVGLPFVAVGVLLAAQPEKFLHYSSAFRASARLFDVQQEQKLFGTTHLEICALLARDLGLGAAFSTGFLERNPEEGEPSSCPVPMIRFCESLQVFGNPGHPAVLHEARRYGPNVIDGLAPEIEKILKSAKALADAVGADLERVSELFGDKRRSEIVHEFDEPELDKSAFIPQEDVYAIVSKDGWIKRIKRTNDPQTTRLRDGDSLLYSGEAKTTDLLVLFTSFGNLFAIPIHELSATTGFGEPVQKLFRFQDSEQIIAARVFFEGELAKQNPAEILCFTQRGLGCRLPVSVVGETKKIGKRIMKLIEGDRMAGVIYPTTPLLLAVSEQGFGLCFATAEVPQLSGAGKGVLLQKLPREDALAAIASVEKKSKLVAKLQDGGEREIEVAKLTLSVRARRGEKLFRRGQGVISLG